MKYLLKTLLVLMFTFQGVNAQFISEVLEYKPAPGQFINSPPYGIPSAANTLIGSLDGLINLGSFGGYLIFRFQVPVENHPDNPFGIDFSLFGNPTSYWSEPGIVSVMKDLNKNGIPDDQWYELAGSDYFFSSTKKNYQVTYTNPDDSVARDIPWADNYGNTGFIFANDFHNQPFYPDSDSFPSVNEKEYVLGGTCISASIDQSNPLFMKSVPRRFGYADNTPVAVPPYTLPDNPYTAVIENSGGDPFDISWAVDENGEYIELDKIDFIKVHNGVLEQADWLGELSTEIRGAVDVEPAPSVSGVNEMIVIRDLPDTLFDDEYQLEVFYFVEGRLQETMEVEWQSNIQGAWVDKNLILKLSQSGDLALTAKLQNNPGISSTIHSKVMLEPTHTLSENIFVEPILYPNPASGFIHISGTAGASVKIYDLQGRMVMEHNNINEAQALEIRHLQKGSYILKVTIGNNSRSLNFLKY